MRAPLLRWPSAALCAVVAPSLAGCGDDYPDDATVSFRAPADGATVAGGVQLSMGADGITIEEAGRYATAPVASTSSPTTAASSPAKQSLATPTTSTSVPGRPRARSTSPPAGGRTLERRRGRDRRIQRVGRNLRFGGVVRLALTASSFMSWTRFR